METATHRMKHRFVDAPRLDKRGNPLRIKILQPKTSASVVVSGDKPADTTEQRIVHAVCPRGMPTDDVRRALFAEFHIEAESGTPCDDDDHPRQHALGRTGHRTVRFALPG